MVSLYFDEYETEQAQAKESQENKDCLLRLYLGDNESQKQEESFYDSLRNFPLRLNMVLDLDLDVFSLSREMPIPLSVAHWQAQVDGMDNGFVLGGAVAAALDRRRPYTQPLALRLFQHLARSILWTLPKEQSTYGLLILIRYHPSVLPKMTSTRTWFQLSWVATHVIPGQMLTRTFGLNLAWHTLRPAPYP